MHRSRPRLLAAGLLAAGAAAARPAAAQPVPLARVQAENDYFDFRRPPDERPDVEFTQGARVAWGVLRPAGWGRFASRLPSCGSGGAGRCGSTTFGVGQLLFNPSVDAPRPLPDQRPYAGWLYASMTARVERARRLTTAAATLGVTGPPSLGAPVQRTFHRAAGFRPLLGWDHQLPTELAGALHVGEALVLAERGALGTRAFDVTAGGGAGVGTWRTAADAGARVRVGYGLAHPWRVARHSGTEPLPRFGLFAVAEGGGEAVARDLTLDGSTFASSPRVDRTPLVAAWAWGGGARVGRVLAEYRLVGRGREHRLGPESHAVGVLAVTVLRSYP